MYRAFLKRDEKGRAILPTEERHHLIGVRRARPGTRFLGFLKGEGWYLCQLDQEQKLWVPRLLGPVEGSSESSLRIVLAQALIKKARFEWALQKSVELGVAEFVPLETTRTEIRIGKDRADRKQGRWEKIIRETVKQCGRDTIPVVHPPAPLSRALADYSCDINLVLDEAAETGLANFLERFSSAAGAPPQEPRPESVLVLVGPEGGWDERDRAVFHESPHPPHPVRLGPRILRAETAPLAVISILQYCLGDLG